MVFLDDHVLMALPEMYRHSKKHEYFGTKLFLAYMLEATAQSAIIFFLILYAYVTTTSRRDGYDVYIDEFSTVSIANVLPRHTSDLIWLIADHGHLCCHDGGPLQWHEHSRLDWLDLLCRRSWHRPHLGLHCKRLSRDY